MNGENPHMNKKLKYALEFWAKTISVVLAILAPITLGAFFFGEVGAYVVGGIYALIAFGWITVMYIEAREYEDG